MTLNIEKRGAKEKLNVYAFQDVGTFQLFDFTSELISSFIFFWKVKSAIEQNLQFLYLLNFQQYPQLIDNAIYSFSFNYKNLGSCLNLEKTLYDNFNLQDDLEHTKENQVQIRFKMKVPAVAQPFFLRNTDCQSCFGYSIIERYMRPNMTNLFC